MPSALRLSLPFVLAAAVLSAQQTLTIPQIAKKVSPCVVVIRGRTGSGDSVGSGFVVSKDGKIVSNLHVIRSLSTAKVLVPNGDVFDSLMVLATDERRDLAVVKVAGFNLPALELGDSDSLAVGQRVIAVGSPLGLEGTVTSGILSAIRESEGYKVIQTDAAVNPGNSGGPLVDESGRVIGGITFKLSSSENLNFAVPINYVRGLLDNLQQPMTLEQLRARIGESETKSEQDNAEPSLSETLEWLTEQIPLGSSQYKTEWKGEKYSHTMTTKIRSMKSCTIALETDEVDRNETTGSSTHLVVRYVVPLATINNGKVGELDHADSSLISKELDKLFGFQARTFLSGDRIVPFSTFYSSSDTILMEWPVGNGRSAANPSTRTFFFSLDALDKQTAQRMLKAILHAADLCRKKEPF